MECQGLLASPDELKLFGIKTALDGCTRTRFHTIVILINKRKAENRAARPDRFRVIWRNSTQCVD